MAIELSDMKEQYDNLLEKHERLLSHITHKQKESMELQSKLTDLMVAIKKHEHGFF